MTNKKTACFCAHIRAALACYVDMTPEQQALAAMYANRKITGLHTLRAAAVSPGGKPRRGVRRPAVAKNAAAGHRQPVTTRIFCAKSAQTARFFA